MNLSFLEIVQLPNGDVVLKRTDRESDPLVSIRFSKESKAHMGEADLDIAKAMIQFGIQAAAQLEFSDEESEEITSAEDEAGFEVHTLH